MGSTLKSKLDSLSTARRNRVTKRAAELVDHELSLRDLRKAMQCTQVEIASKMKVGQDAVSRCEQRTDMMLSTLERYVTAMGGTLRLVAEFPNREPVRLRTLGELSAAGSGASDNSDKRAGRRSVKRS